MLQVQAARPRSGHVPQLDDTSRFDDITPSRAWPLLNGRPWPKAGSRSQCRRRRCEDGFGLCNGSSRSGESSSAFKEALAASRCQRAFGERSFLCVLALLAASP